MYRPLVVPSPAQISILGGFGVTDCVGRRISEAYWLMGASFPEQAENLIRQSCITNDLSPFSVNTIYA